MYNQQQGAVLIVVLACLLLITLIGVVVVRNSTTDLRLATASQIDSLLFIAADQPNAKLEQQSNDPNSDLFSSTDGALGYFMNEINESNAEHELVFCYRPKQPQLFQLVKAARYSAPANDGTVGRLDSNSTRPFCNPSVNADFISARNAVATQMSITRGAAPVATSDDVPTGVDLSNSNNKTYSLNVNTVSALPAYGSASSSTIATCYQKATRGGDTVSSCLENNGVPSKAVAQNYLAKFQDNMKQNGTAPTGPITAPTAAPSAAAP